MHNHQPTAIKYNASHLPTMDIENMETVRTYMSENLALFKSVGGVVGVVELFLKTSCELDIRKQVSNKLLYERFKAWCLECAVLGISNKMLSSVLQKHGVAKVHRRDGIHWIGLTFK
jgi:hypothetical protein